MQFPEPQRWRLSVAPMMDRPDYLRFMRVPEVPCAIGVQFRSFQAWNGSEILSQLVSQRTN
jgi:hypothetical protein